MRHVLRDLLLGTVTYIPVVIWSYVLAVSIGSNLQKAGARLSANLCRPMNILYCFIGVLLGTLVGVLPGIGPTATIAMLLPITFSLSPAGALIMLAGIYYGAQYGGSTTAILINLPGESSSAVTAIDGYQMAKKGRAGPALATAALGSFFAGTVATLLLAFFAPPLARAGPQPRTGLGRSGSSSM